MRGNRLRELQGLRPPFRLLNAFVAAARAAVCRRRCIHGVFAAENPASQVAVRHNPEPMVRGGGQLLNLGRAVGDVVERLARHGAINAKLVGDAHDLGNAPAMEV
ncbi:hypothetical protein UB46_41195 [Burkholderiaceae bacterium 16]|nr:hypothetical protein UB46_41195 [Burkholderiaceae bacterium 16]